MNNTIIALNLMVLSFNSLAAEADNFTARQLEIADSSAIVNQLANDYLEKALNNLNQVSACDEKQLYKELRKYFANHSKGEFTKDLLYKNVAPIYNLPLKESIYENWTIPNGFILGRKKAALSPLALSPLIRIGDEVVGVDKFEHMFGMGHQYFTKYHLKRKDIQNVLKFGIAFEKTVLGGNVLATGVFSYADLAANFNGMRFWNHFLQKDDDILGKEYNLGPYVVCQNNKWQSHTQNKIDFSNYIDSSMDESINCSKFATKAAVAKAKSAIKKRQLSNGSSLCPLEDNKLRTIQRKYNVKNIEHFIINKDGIGDVSYFNEF